MIKVVTNLVILQYLKCIKLLYEFNSQCWLTCNSEQIPCLLSFLKLHIAAFNLFRKHLLSWEHINRFIHCGHFWSRHCFFSYRLASSLSCQQLASNLVATIGFICYKVFYKWLEPHMCQYFVSCLGTLIKYIIFTVCAMLSWLWSVYPRHVVYAYVIAVTLSLVV